MKGLLENLCETFDQQDYENGFFDVIFLVEGKELYAHRAVLASVSNVFKEMFKQSKSDEPVNQSILINDYSYDEFEEFLSYIYTPYDDVDGDIEYWYTDYFKHIYAVAELARSYEIEGLQWRCEYYLARVLNINKIDDLFVTLEFAYNYSMDEYEERVYDFVTENFSTLTEDTGFVNLDKSAVEAFVCFSNDVEEDELCKAIYKWAEHQAAVNEIVSKEEKNELVLNEISDFIPMLEFKYMSSKFLFEFAVEKGLISIEEANEHALVTVTVKCGDKKLMGSFVDVYGIHKLFRYNNPKKLVGTGQKFRCFWDKVFEFPSTPSTVQKKKGVEWYFLFDENGKLFIKHKSAVERNDYVIAEMKAANSPSDSDETSDTNFICNEKADVYASVSRGK